MGGIGRMGEDKKRKAPKRKTTALDRAVIRFQEKGKQATFERIYHAIFRDVKFLSEKYLWLFPGLTMEDLMQEAYLHISLKVIPKYNAEEASFRTLASISIKNKFRQLLQKIRKSENEPTGIPSITFTEYEFNSGIDGVDFEDSKDFVDEILISDFLRLFKERLTAEHWKIYWKIYKDPKLNFKGLAKDRGLSIASLYRKCHSIYSFLKMLIDKENENG
jgi:hypothetical protein